MTEHTDGPDDALFLHILAGRMANDGHALMAGGALNGKVMLNTAKRLHEIANRIASLPPDGASGR